MANRSFIKITGLIWANILTEYVMRVMMTYLTDVWKLNFTHAAGIMNVYEGIIAILPIAMYFLVNTFMGNYWMLLLSSAASSFGLSFLAMSTPPVLSKATSTCSAYEPECIGNVQSSLFYTALVLIAVGKSGHLVSIGSFCDEQSEDDVQNHESQNGYCGIFMDCFAGILIPITGSIAVAYIKPWSIGFGIAAICTVVATLFFVSGSSSYGRAKPRMYQALEIQEYLTPKVKETKNILLMILMWMTIIPVGLVLSIGNTYFLEQANHLNPKIGRLKVPLPVLLMVYDYAKLSVTKRYNKKHKERDPMYIPPVGIAVGMTDSILCCIIAALVEHRTINVIKKHGLVDKPNDRIPMSMFWLLPQFIFLGWADGTVHVNVECLSQYLFPNSNYMAKFNEAVFGAGIIGGVFSIYIVGKVNERGGRSSWFGDTLNHSRLDNYYWTLAALSSINLVLYILVSNWYVCSVDEDD